jgi:hypothetical protein
VGHYYEHIEGKGKDRAEAFWDAWDAYQIEHGTRCSLRSDWLANDDTPWHGSGGDLLDLEDYGDGKPCCYGELVETVPPLKWVEHEVKEERSIGYRYPGGRYGEYVGKPAVALIQQPDPDAPKDQWLQRWRFRVHYHA